MRAFFVDDGIISIENATGTIHLAKEARELCTKGGLHLHKFISNNKAVVENVPVSEHATNFQDRNVGT